jgi:hypothetical protein
MSVCVLLYDAQISDEMQSYTCDKILFFVYTPNLKDKVSQTVL